MVRLVHHHIVVGHRQFQQVLLVVVRVVDKELGRAVVDMGLGRVDTGVLVVVVGLGTLVGQDKVVVGHMAEHMAVDQERVVVGGIVVGGSNLVVGLRTVVVRIVHHMVHQVVALGTFWGYGKWGCGEGEERMGGELQGNFNQCDFTGGLDSKYQPVER